VRKAVLESGPKLNLPRVNRLVLRDFSLYTAQPSIDITFNDGVFCLAGANGLGKSTFLSALNFAVTGRVSDPSRTFQSINEYYRHTADFSSEFFAGRIRPSDHETAEAYVEMSVGKQSYRLTRGMFEPDELRSLEILQEDGSSLVQADHPSNADLHALYTGHIANDVGLHTFEQFVFLQLFVFTFDERRHLLFWDNKVLERTLFIAFGMDQKDAELADELARGADRADSLVRNTNWQATDLRKKLEDLQSATGALSLTDSAPEDIQLRHEDLVASVDELSSKHQRCEGALKDVLLEISDLSARQSSLRSDYEAEFARRFRTSADVEYNPVIAASLASGRCELCGSQARTVAAVIRAHLSKNECPLCEQGLAPVPQAGIGELQTLDEKISEIRLQLSDAMKEKSRLDIRSQESASQLAVARTALVAFEAENSSILDRLARTNSDEPAVEAMRRYRKQIDELLEKKRGHLERRNRLRKEHASLQKGLAQRYDEAEADFVPSFTDLAHRFLGLDLDIRLDAQKASGLNILLEVKSSARREFHQLSESQRFFIDMALRMALIKHMSSKTSKGCFYVDTPEGSLDIAYESRAGDMFASFVHLGFGIVMTANINSSRLLVSLAEECGTKLMNLCRMTAWTDLSDVQIQEEDLFNQAFSQIERAMVKGRKRARPRRSA
jgi:DNA repair exonuclease SbcCD ATPase subunit